MSVPPTPALTIDTPSIAVASPHARPRFGENDGFQAELRRRVEDFFRRTGKNPRDCAQMYVKTCVILAVFFLSYIVLVFLAHTPLQAIAAALMLGGSAGMIGFNIQHDGSHLAYSDHPWINKLTAMSMDLIGASSYLWHWKHVASHHIYVNITDHDADVDLGAFARVTPHQPHYFFHRLQHFYLWALYGFMTIRWHLYGDFRDLVTRDIGGHPFPRPKGRELAIFIGGKAVFFTLAFVVPLFLHTWWKVLLFYVLVASVVGVVLSVVFQLAHCVEEADFPMPDQATNRMEDNWMVHQIHTTVDFARNSRLVCWLLGGLNFQVEHHLFPRICHIHYPEISKIVESTCREFGVRYNEHKTLWAGLVSHYRWLRRLSVPAGAN
ncbi:MAG: acyl-CoA desaturase [Opitutae bacterium]|nr:acyl-CoA desaturase [Opitutae bacterium]